MAPWSHGGNSVTGGQSSPLPRWRQEEVPTLSMLKALPPTLLVPDWG